MGDPVDPVGEAAGHPPREVPEHNGEDEEHQERPAQALPDDASDARVVELAEGLEEGCEQGGAPDARRPLSGRAPALQAGPRLGIFRRDFPLQAGCLERFRLWRKRSEARAAPERSNTKKLERFRLWPKRSGRTASRGRTSDRPWPKDLTQMA